MACRVFGQVRGRALFDQFLVPPLHRAVAFPEVDDVAVLVGQDLDLDVAGAFDVLLEVDVGVAEGGLGLGLCLLQGRFERQVVRRDRIPLPPPPAAALISTGKPISWATRSASFSSSTSDRRCRARRARRPPARAAGLVLVAQQLHRLGRRADEVDLAAAADLVEMGVLGQKAVAGMDRLDVADLRRADHPVDLQVAVGRLGGPDAIGLVGQFQIGAAAIRLAEDGHRLDAHLATGADDPQGDFAAIGYQDSLVHRSPRPQDGAPQRAAPIPN